MGLREQAANLGRTIAPYTVEMFLEDFPQFTNNGSPLCPYGVLERFVENAGRTISPDKWGDWRYACGLYTAHYMTLYLQSYAESSATPQQAAATGTLMGVLKSAALGDSSVTYDTSALTAATEKWGSLNATRYGQQLASEARLVGMGGTFVI